VLLGWTCPGHNESAGKRKSSKTKKGNKYLKSALTEAVQGSLSTFLHNLILFQQNIKLIFNNRFLLVEIKTRRYSSQRIAPDC
jgi:hypothetical protein